MKMQTISVDLPSDILLALNESENDLKKDIKFSLAIQFYQKQKLTIGKAAQLAGLSRYDFETLLAENNIPISNLSIDDIIEDSTKIK